VSTLRTYDLSIISAQEAAERLGVIAAEREERFDEWGAAGRIKQNRMTPDEAYVYGANRATVALDVLALRKAQVLLTTQDSDIEAAIEAAAMSNAFDPR
jgi:hypothetical protein